MTWYTIPGDVKPAGAVILLDAVTVVYPIAGAGGPYALRLGGLDFMIYADDRDRLARVRNAIIGGLPK